MTISIYIANLGKYNEGEIIGEWLTLPATNEEIQNIFKRIGIDGDYEEWIILDYESDIQYLKIHEHDNIETLNEYAKAWEELDDDEKLAVVAYLKEIYSDFEEAHEVVKNGDYIIYRDCVDMEAVAREFLYNTGYFHNLPDDIIDFFDFEKYGDYMKHDGNFVFIEDNCVWFYY